MKRINGMHSILNKGKNVSHTSRQLHLSWTQSAKHLQDPSLSHGQSHNYQDLTPSHSEGHVEYGDILNGNQQEKKIALDQLRNQPAYLARYRSLDPFKGSITDVGKERERERARNATQVDNLDVNYENRNSEFKSQSSNRKNKTSIPTTINHSITTSSAHPLTSSSSTIINRSHSSSSSSSSSSPSSSSSGSTKAFPIRSSSSSSHSSNPQTKPSNPSEKDKDSSSWAFGGGASSRGGPVTAHDFMEQQAAASTSSNIIPQNGVIGSAGKGAVPGYGKRKKELLPEHKFLGRNSFDETLSQKDLELARNYKHEYAPTTRSSRPLPQHTYFTSPSTSFNASSQVTSGISKSRPGAISTGAKRKKTALISPGQGSQYVAMSRDLYKAFRSARTTWNQAEEALLYTPNLSSMSSLDPSDRSHSLEQRELFEKELEKSYPLDSKRGFAASGTAIVRGKRGYLRDTVFSGDQLDLTRSENAQPSILTCTISFLNVLRKEFDVDLISEHVSFSAGHGSGTYASLVASGCIDFNDALRGLRHRGLIASHYVLNNQTLFPKGSVMPDSIYESWAFANAGSGRGAELVDAMMDKGGVPITNSTTDGEVVRNESRLQEDDVVSGKNVGVSEGLVENVKRGWKRTQMSGFMVRAGKLNGVLSEVSKIASEIRSNEIPGVASDEVVEIANINSQLQVVLSGTRVGVSLACDRLRNLGLGARAVNLPVSGPYHTSLMKDAAESLYPMVKNVPLKNPSSKLGLISSVNGKILKTEDDVRQDLFGALYKPVRWLDSIDTMVQNGVERFICLGPGRACAHLLSKELALRDKLAGNSFGSDESKRQFEVWSVATVEDVEQLGGVLSRISAEEGVTSRTEEPVSDQIMAL